MNSLFLRDDMSNWHYPRPPVIYNCSNMAIKAVKRLYRPINSAYNAWNGLCIFYVKISLNSRQIKTKASLKSRKKKILFHDWSLYIIQGFTLYFLKKNKIFFYFQNQSPHPFLETIYILFICLLRIPFRKMVYEFYLHIQNIYFSLGRIRETFFISKQKVVKYIYISILNCRT